MKRTKSTATTTYAIGKIKWKARNRHVPKNREDNLLSVLEEIRYAVNVLVIIVNEYTPNKIASSSRFILVVWLNTKYTIQTLIKNGRYTI